MQQGRPVLCRRNCFRIGGMTCDLIVINPLTEPSCIPIASEAASTWLWEHGDLIPRLLSEVLLVGVIVAMFVWRERSQAQGTDDDAMRRIGTREIIYCRRED